MLGRTSHSDDLRPIDAAVGKLQADMQPLDKAPSTKRFGSFEVDLRARELRKGGVRIRLQSQPFEILAAMLERPGEVVTREELRQRLWPAGTFVDFEHSLNAAIKRLRLALGDDADNPRFVETLHRRGYRFIAALDGSLESGTPFNDVRLVGRPYAKMRRDAATVRLAVLPFANVGGDSAQEYFSDGLTEEMITQIGRLCPGRLGVIARTSSMLFKNTPKSACEIGRDLSVDYLLEGSVRREGERVRITAQLIELPSEVHLWAETYDRSIGESLIVQTDVAAHIARSLAMELVPDQVDVIGRSTSRRTEAYQAYLKGRYHWNRATLDGATTALSYYARALEIDPQFAAAHAATARARVALVNHSIGPGRTSLEQARESALQAIQLDPGVSDAHVALAEVRRTLEWNWRVAEDEDPDGYRALAELRDRAQVLRPVSRSNGAVSRGESRGGSRVRRRPVLLGGGDERGVGQVSGGRVRRSRGALPPCARHGGRLPVGSARTWRHAAGVRRCGKRRERVRRVDSGRRRESHRLRLARARESRCRLTARGRRNCRAPRHDGRQFCTCRPITSRWLTPAWETTTPRSRCSRARPPIAIRRSSTWPSNRGSHRCGATSDMRSWSATWV